VQITAYSRVETGEFLEITYVPPREIPLLPLFQPGSDSPLAAARTAWFAMEFADLHGLWQRAGGYDCESFTFEVTIPGGWLAEMKPNPAEIVIIKAGHVGRTPVSHVAWNKNGWLSLAAQSLMTDLLCCYETKEPTFQYIRTGRLDYYQLLLPAKGRVYGLRKAADAAARRIEAQHTVDA
jgi:hypothetical protein